MASKDGNFVCLFFTKEEGVILGGLNKDDIGSRIGINDAENTARWKPFHGSVTIYSD